jgi:uncharacterized protein
MERLYHIAGTHCRSCQIFLEQRLGELPGVESVRVDYRTGKTRVRVSDAAPADEAAVARTVTDAGYRLATGPVQRTLLSHDPADWTEALVAACIVFVLYLGYRLTGLDQLGTSLATASSAGGALIVGLVAGVSTCMALIGSMVLAMSARHAQQYPYLTAWQRIRPNLFFNAGRVAGFALLGGLAGVVGGIFRIQGQMLALLVMLAAGMMVVLGIKLTGLAPRLEGLALPAGFARLVGLGRTPERYSHYRSAATGVLTFFLPCAFTQTMQLLAISTGSFFQGTLIMSAFALGTAPGLIGIGSIAGSMRGPGGRMFMKVAGVAVLLLGIWNFGNGWTLTGITFGSSTATIGAPSDKIAVAQVRYGKQYVATTQVADGYEPSRLRVKAGIPVVWTITSANPYTCAASLYIPLFNIIRDLEEGPNIIEFTPTKTGLIKYSCTMGMFGGGIEVIE